MSNEYFNLAKSEVEIIPFPHFISSSVLSKEDNINIYNWLQETNLWEYTETTFYEQYEFSLLEVLLPEPLQFLSSVNTLQTIKDTFAKEFNSTNFELVDIVAHKLVDNHRIGVHNDFIGNEETHRLVLQINPYWTEDNGGFLILFNSSLAEDISKIISPINNTAFGFEISEKSYHAVSKIHNFCRYSIVYTFKNV